MNSEPEERQNYLLTTLTTNAKKLNENEIFFYQISAPSSCLNHINITFRFNSKFSYIAFFYYYINVYNKWEVPERQFFCLKYENWNENELIFEEKMSQNKASVQIVFCDYMRLIGFITWKGTYIKILLLLYSLW